MTDLSPAAQAVLDAFENARDGEYVEGVWVVNERTMLAAALRATANRLECDMPEDSAYAAGYYEALEEISGIAADLEGADQSTKSTHLEHPITPPPELIEQWRTAPEYTKNSSKAMLVSMTISKLQEIVTQAARWGADQELEACCKWLEHGPFGFSVAVPEKLRADRRPQPGLKERALDALAQIDTWAIGNVTHLTIHDELVSDVEIIRRALESLSDESLPKH